MPHIRLIPLWITALLCFFTNPLIAGVKEDNALFEAVKNGDKQKTLDAIKFGANVNAKANYDERINAIMALKKRSGAKISSDSIPCGCSNRKY